MKNQEPNYYRNLLKKINEKKVKVGVIGLGYVGLNLLYLFSKKINSFGFDKNLQRIKKIKKYDSYLSDINNSDLKNIKPENLYHSKSFKKITEMDVIIITVPTPLNSNNSPNIRDIENVIKKIIRFLKFGQCIILESTVYPGATEKILGKTLEKFKFSIGKNFFLSYSPERISPGDLMPRGIKIQNVPKVVAGYSNNCLNIASKIYKLVFYNLAKTNNLKEAEMSKLLENTYRAVNISLINEIKIICDKVGLNIHKIINLAKTKPFGFTRFNPGPGIGGHCIPVDPFFLSWYAEKNKVASNFIKYSGKLNSKIKNWIFKKILTIGKKMKKKRLNVFFIGITYKKNINDIRESPAIDIMKKCIKNKMNVSFNDPYVKKIKINGKNINSHSLNRNLRNIDIAILTTDHKVFNYNDIFKKFNLIIDTRGKYSYSNDKKIIHA